MSDRVQKIHEAFSGADIQSYTAEDGRVPIWEKFVFLAALAGFTGAARLPIGPVWGDPFTKAQFLAGCREIEAVARAEGVPVAADVVERIIPYIDAIPGTMRSSLLIDLQAGQADRSRSSAGHRRPPRRRARRPDADHVDAVCRPQAARGVVN